MRTRDMRELIECDATQEDIPILILERKYFLVVGAFFYFVCFLLFFFYFWKNLGFKQGILPIWSITG